MKKVTIKKDSNISPYGQNMLRVKEQIEAELTNFNEKVIKPAFKNMDLFNQDNVITTHPKDYLIVQRRDPVLEELQDIRGYMENKKTGSQEVCLVYRYKDSSLKRTIDGEEFKYSFSAAKKRQKLIELLLKKDGYIPTKKLCEILGSSDRALWKSVQEINEKVRYKLNLTSEQNIIKNDPALGYRINEHIVIKSDKS